MPDGLLDGGKTITAAVGLDDEVDYMAAAWTGLALSTQEINANTVRETTLKLTFSDSSICRIEALSYAGVIDELDDFPRFFNNTPVNGVAPNVYGYYIVIKDLGTGVEEVTLTQTSATDYTATNGFNGVLDGQGHTLKFQLMKGGLVGLVLGNAVIKNLRVIYKDASFISQAEGGGYGVFGYVTNGYPEIRNCYIERTENLDSRSSVYGIMARPNGKLILHNTVVYGFNVKNNCSWWSNCWINETSTNAYVVCGRSNMADLEAMSMSKNFTKVYTNGDGTANQSRAVSLADVTDPSGFDDAYWSKDGSIDWKGAGNSVLYTAVSVAA